MTLEEFIKLANLGASLATAGAFLLASYAFLSDRRYRKFEFTMNAISKYQKAVSPEIISEIAPMVRPKAELVKMANTDFITEFWSSEMSKLREATEAISEFYMLIETKKLDFEVLGKGRIFSRLKEHYERLGPYITKSREVHGLEDLQIERRLEQLEYLRLRYS